MSRAPMDTYVFLGPTLPIAAAAALCDAAFLPPVAVFDLHRLVRALPKRRPARIAIIDGYFERMAAVWHKEILDALERGIEVWGAASMGALRAAELAPFGMVGVGRVFADLRRGRLGADDEFAVLHGPAESGYVAMSDAMVNLRAGLAAARSRGVIAPAHEAALVELGRARFYRERSWAQLIDDGRAAGLPRGRLDALQRHVAAHPIDVKAADARALLRRLARTPPAARRPPGWRMSRTWFWHRFVELADEVDG
jgi:hypothetical protein